MNLPGYDRWKTEGNWHYCPECRTRWCDADGGCNCEPEPEECDKEVTDPEERKRIYDKWYRQPIVNEDEKELSTKPSEVK